ncbi:MAG: glutaredoxin domain-containing protein [Nitrospirota bacterium]|jgi:glutaredoxin
MKRLIALIVIIAIVRYWHGINAFVTGDRHAASPEVAEIELYVTSWCGYCRAARSYFDRLDVPYEEYDIERDPVGKYKYDQYGVPGVPLIVINDQVIRGFNRNAIDAALAGRRMMDPKPLSDMVGDLSETGVAVVARDLSTM